MYESYDKNEMGFYPQYKKFGLFWVSIPVLGNEYVFIEYADTLEVAQESIEFHKAKIKFKKTPIEIINID